jgi:hypothetical protein
MNTGAVTLLYDGDGNRIGKTLAAFLSNHQKAILTCGWQFGEAQLHHHYDRAA